MASQWPPSAWSSSFSLSDQFKSISNQRIVIHSLYAWVSALIIRGKFFDGCAPNEFVDMQTFIGVYLFIVTCTLMFESMRSWPPVCAYFVLANFLADVWVRWVMIPQYNGAMDPSSFVGLIFSGWIIALLVGWLGSTLIELILKGKT